MKKKGDKRGLGMGHEFGAGRGTAKHRDKRTKRARTRREAVRKAVAEHDV